MKSPKQLARELVNKAVKYSYSDKGCIELIELALVKYGAMVKEECAKVAIGYIHDESSLRGGYCRKITDAIRSMEIK